MNNILIVEDNKDVANMLQESLSSFGYETKAVHTGIDGINELRRINYDLMLLDIMLPYKSGDEVLKEARTFSQLPVIIISAKDLIGTKIDLLKLGADDYITKPFDLGEVSARVESLLRRCGKTSDSKTTYSHLNMLVDPMKKEVSIHGKIIDLTAKEYMIIEMLIKHKDKVFTKANIYESVWQDEYFGDDNTIKTHMSNLRTKLKKASPDESYIETVWGLGYRMQKAI